MCLPFSSGELRVTPPALLAAASNAAIPFGWSAAYSYHRRLMLAQILDPRPRSHDSTNERCISPLLTRTYASSSARAAAAKGQQQQQQQHLDNSVHFACPCVTLCLLWFSDSPRDDDEGYALGF
ncbi:hypothetical protein CF319_g7829 [Tilletia indica]|nr:hypothetical protein CF319_g7829 [Tilletia indica]